MLKLLLPTFTAVSLSPAKSGPAQKPNLRDKSGRQAPTQVKLPNVSGAFSREDAEIVVNNWQYPNCTLRLVKHELLELSSSNGAASSMTGNLRVFFSARLSYDAADTVDILRAYRDPGYRSPKAACETLHPQPEEYRSMITITTTAVGLVYEELVKSPSVRQPTLQRKEGDQWPGTLEFLDSNRSIKFDRVRIFTRV